jgi:hypothetical protein
VSVVQPRSQQQWSSILRARLDTCDPGNAVVTILRGIGLASRLVLAEELVVVGEHERDVYLQFVRARRGRVPRR